MIYYQTRPTFWLADVKPQTARPLQNVNNLTLCSRAGARTPPMIQQLNWSRHLPSDWWHSQNRGASLHWPDYARAHVSVGVCLCGTSEVIISGGRGGTLLSLLLCRVELSWAGTPSWSLSARPPPALPWVLFPPKRHSVNLLSAFEEALLWLPPLSRGRGEV